MNFYFNTSKPTRQAVAMSMGNDQKVQCHYEVLTRSTVFYLALSGHTVHGSVRYSLGEAMARPDDSNQHESRQHTQSLLPNSIDLPLPLYTGSL